MSSRNGQFAAGPAQRVEGSSVADFVSPDFKHTAEVKSYNISQPEGVTNYNPANDPNVQRLINASIAQAKYRKTQIPEGTTQHLFIDIAGQDVSRNTKNYIKKAIAEKSNGIFDIDNIKVERYSQ